MGFISTTIPADARKRMLCASADIFDKLGRQAAPVDVNAASALIKDSLAQTAQAPPMVEVPESVLQASHAALAAIWLQAQALANESLHSAQTAWEAERKELAAENAAVEKHAEELACVQQKLADVVDWANRTLALAADIDRRSADLRAELNQAHAEVERLREDAKQIRKQAAGELEAAHAETNAIRAQLGQLQAHTAPRAPDPHIGSGRCSAKP